MKPNDILVEMIAERSVRQKVHVHPLAPLQIGISEEPIV